MNTYILPCCTPLYSAFFHLFHPEKEDVLVLQRHEPVSAVAKQVAVDLEHVEAEPLICASLEVYSCAISIPVPLIYLVSSQL